MRAGNGGNAQTRRGALAGDHFVAGTFYTNAHNVESDGGIANAGRSENFDSQGSMK